MPVDLSASLPGDLPPGRLVRVADGPELFWLSDASPDLDLYRRLLAAHPGSGLWPVITAADPWIDGLVPESVADADALDLLTVMRGFWADVLPVEGEEELFGEDGLADFEPFGREFPGLAAAGTPMAEPQQVADWFAGELDLGAAPRLMLAPAARGADVPAVVGWTGPTNHTNQVAPLVTILRSWEDRFGVRLVGLGFDTLELSVAAPPTTPEHAVQVAAEHLMFCPDNVEQGPGSLREYAAAILGVNSWSFWWD
ncbi:DUF4253 domain-containing protein [Kribbella sp. NPDC050124]|uniref:DUF4253 domain-containing protein n=1 Tax=Kribbella sp. NPDC050124 TaxID=3364114 RepID=UPI0037B3CBA5